MRSISSFFGLTVQLFMGLALFFVVGTAHAAIPLVANFSPADNANGVAVAADLIVTFDQTIVASGGTLEGSSTVSLYKSDGTLIEEFGAGSGAITVSSAEVTINPTLNLLKNTAYYVLIDDDAFENSSNEVFAGISDTTTWNFRTIGGGGGAAARRARALLLNDMPQFYSVEAPSLEDVGIFKPEEHSAADVTEKVALKPQLPNRLVRTGYDPSAVERYSRLQRRITQVALADPETDDSDSGEQEYQSNQHRRVCQRVVRRVAGNQLRLDRINSRLQRHRGYTCSF